MKIPIYIFSILLPISLKGQRNNFTLGGNITLGNLYSYTVTFRTILKSPEDRPYQMNFSPSIDFGKISNQEGKFELRRREFYSILNYEKPKKNFKLYISNESENSF